MKYLTFPKPFRLFYTASHSFSGRVLKANCPGPISGNIIRTVVQARMSDRSTTKILSGSRRMTIAYRSWWFISSRTYISAGSSSRGEREPQAPMWSHRVNLDKRVRSDHPFRRINEEKYGQELEHEPLMWPHFCATFLRIKSL
jgi:hypothetical protein